MVKQHFSHITTWVFDLDNTLYPPRYRLFDQIEVRMTAWVMRALNVGATEANRLRQHYWDTYGTTLAGLMREHNIDPAPYLTDVHEIDFSALPRDPVLASHLRARHTAFYQRTADEAELLLSEERQLAKAEDLGRIDTFRFEESTVLEAALDAPASDREEIRARASKAMSNYRCDEEARLGADPSINRRRAREQLIGKLPPRVRDYLRSAEYKREVLFRNLQTY
jgi:hypothetical protein